MKNFIVVSCLLATLNAFATDPRDKAVLASPMVKAIQKGLRREQGLKCVATRDEDGNLTVNYLIEDGLSKFELFLDCSTRDGLNAVVKGVLGDGGQTAVESFRMQTGVN
jgi:hypothetical protein